MLEIRKIAIKKIARCGDGVVYGRAKPDGFEKGEAGSCQLISHCERDTQRGFLEMTTRSIACEKQLFR